MIEVELRIPNNSNNKLIIETVENVCAANGLACALKGTLGRYPGCVHWHYKKGKQKGTLEITWWERQNLLWFKVAENRRGKWMDDALTKLKKEIEVSLNNDPKERQVP